MRLFQLGFHYPYLTDWRHVSFCFFAGVLEQRASGLAANSTVAIRLSKIDLSPKGTALSAAHRSVAHWRDTQKGNDWEIDDCHDKRSITKYRGICFFTQHQSGKIALYTHKHKDLCQIHTNQEKSNDRIDQFTDQALLNDHKCQTNYDTYSHILRTAVAIKPWNSCNEAFLSCNPPGSSFTICFTLQYAQGRSVLPQIMRCYNYAEVVRVQ